MPSIRIRLYALLARARSPTRSQPIIMMDRKVISEAGYQDCVVFAISNSDDLEGVELTAGFSEKVDAGAPILKVTFK